MSTAEEALQNNSADPVDHARGHPGGHGTTQLRLTHVDRAFGTAERHSWEADRNWQPIRRAVELALVEGQAMIEAGTALLAVPGARTADEMAAEVRSEWAALLEPVGL